MMSSEFTFPLSVLQSRYFRYMIQTEGKKEKNDGASLNVGEKKHRFGPGYEVDAAAVSSKVSDFIEPGTDYSSSDARGHFNGNDYLTFQNLPDYLEHLNNGVIDSTVNQVGKSDRKQR